MSLAPLDDNSRLTTQPAQPLRAVLTLANGYKLPISFRPAQDHQNPDAFENCFSTTYDCLPTLARNWLAKRVIAENTRRVRAAKRAVPNQVPDKIRLQDEYRAKIVSSADEYGHSYLTADGELQLIFEAEPDEAKRTFFVGTISRFETYSQPRPPSRRRAN